MEFSNGSILIIELNSNNIEQGKIIKYNEILLNEIKDLTKINTNLLNKIKTKVNLKLNTDFLNCEYD